MVVVAVPALNEYRGVRQTLRVHLAAHVVQVYPLPYVTPRVLDGGVPVHVAELAETESVTVVRRIREAVHYHRVGVAVEHLANSTVQLVVGYGSPVERFLIGDGGDFAWRFGIVGGRGVRGGRSVR